MGKRTSICILAVFALMAFMMGCGGGGGSTPTTISYPSDDATVVPSMAAYSVIGVTNITQPAVSSSPSSLNRIVKKTAGRTLNSVTSNLGNLNGTVGEQFTVTYTNEPQNNCVVNGTLNGTIQSVSSTAVAISYGGTLNYTQCTSSPNITVTISNATMSVTATTVTSTMPATFAYSGKSYTASITAVTEAADSSGTTYVTSESYTGSDSLGNTFNYGTKYYTTGQHYQTYNKNTVNSASNNFSCQFYSTTGYLRCKGMITLSNNVYISIPGSMHNYTNEMYFQYTEAADTSGDIVTYNLSLSSGTGKFGYYHSGHNGTLTLNNDGSGSGTLNDSSGTLVATMTWNAAGLCSIDYADNSTFTDKQMYVSNIKEALN